MAKDKKEGVLRKAMKGMCSMTLLVFLFLVGVYLFPRVMLFLTFVLLIPFIWRRLPLAKQA